MVIVGSELALSSVLMSTAVSCLLLPARTAAVCMIAVILSGFGSEEREGGCLVLELEFCRVWA